MSDPKEDSLPPAVLTDMSLPLGVQDLRRIADFGLEGTILPNRARAVVAEIERLELEIKRLQVELLEAQDEDGDTYCIECGHLALDNSAYCGACEPVHV